MLSTPKIRVIKPEAIVSRIFGQIMDCFGRVLDVVNAGVEFQGSETFIGEIARRVWDWTILLK
jgi:hypothetical protein